MSRDPEHTLITHSPEETRQLGKSIGGLLSPGSVVLLSGPLGAGKSVFVSGVAMALDIEGPIVSPTYTIVCEYEGRIPLCHVDLFRIEGEREFDLLGLEETLHGSGITVIEWPERAGEAIEDALKVTFEFVSVTDRRITYPSSLGIAS